MATKASFAPESSPRVSVVVVAWRSAPYLLDCLRAVESTVRDVPYEVIVVLNEPTRELESVVAERIDGVTSVRTRVNLGFAGAANAGAARARGEHVVLLNDDTEVLPGWLESLVETAERRPELGAVGSKVLFPDGTVQELGAVLWRDGSATNVGRGLPSSSQRYDFERQVDYCSGCSLLVRRAAFAEVQGLDDGYFPAYYEDVDLCMRLRQVGWGVWVQPSSEVRHRLSASTSGAYRSFLLERNRELFLRRWGGDLADRDGPAPDEPAAIDRAVWRAMGEPARVLVVPDRRSRLPPDGGAVERLLEIAAAVVGSARPHLVVAAGAGSGDVPRGALGRLGVEVTDGSVEQCLDRRSPPWSLVVAVGGEAYARVAPVVRSSAPSVPILLDADEGGGSGLAAAVAEAEAELVVCSGDPGAGLDRGLQERLHVAGSVVWARSGLPLGRASPGERRRPGSSPAQVPGAARPGERGDGGEQARSRVVTWASTVPSRLLADGEPITEAEIEALLREAQVRDAYARRLEGQVEQLLAELRHKDEHLVQTEHYAHDLDAQLKALDAQVGALDAQLKALDADVEAKNEYVREKEAQAASLWGERTALAADLAREQERVAALADELARARERLGQVGAPAPEVASHDGEGDLEQGAGAPPGRDRPPHAGGAEPR